MDLHGTKKKRLILLYMKRYALKYLTIFYQQAILTSFFRFAYYSSRCFSELLLYTSQKESLLTRNTTKKYSRAPHWRVTATHRMTNTKVTNIEI